MPLLIYTKDSGKLIFGTTNENKLSEAGQILQIELEGLKLDVDEIQSNDPTEVATRKAQAYFKICKKPLFVEDVSLSFSGLNGLPGPFIDFFHKSLDNDGLLDLVRDKDRKATAKTTICFIDDVFVKTFVGEIRGSLPTKPKGKNGFGWDPIFMPEGSKKTFAEMRSDEKNKFSMRQIALQKLKKRLEKEGKVK